MKLAPKQTYGTVVHEAKAADGVGAGRGYHEMDTSLTLEIDRIVDVNRHSALVRFVGTELNDRWVTLEEMHTQSLADRLADFHMANGTTAAPGKKPARKAANPTSKGRTPPESDTEAPPVAAGTLTLTRAGPTADFATTESRSRAAAPAAGHTAAHTAPVRAPESDPPTAAPPAKKRGRPPTRRFEKDREPASLNPRLNRALHTMPSTLVSRLEAARTHDSFQRKYHTPEQGWDDNCSQCGGPASESRMLLCSFCEKGYHMLCLPGMEHRVRAPKGD